MKELSAFKGLAESKKKGDAWILEIEEGKAFQKEVLAVLEKLDSKLYRNREAFLEAFDETFKKSDIKLPVSLKKRILEGLSERDEEADICLDSKGNPEPDSELRDTENVPYEQDIYEYFAKEVKPYAPDAWIDEKKIDDKDGKVGRVGYEIPVTRYFYEYQPPRALEEIETDIEQVENELLGLFKELTK